MKLGLFVRTLLSVLLLSWALPSCVVEVSDAEGDEMGIFEDLDAMDDMDTMDMLSPTGGRRSRLVNDDILPPYSIEPHVGRSVSANPRNTTFGNRVEMPVDGATGTVDTEATISVVNADISEINPHSVHQPGSWVVVVTAESTGTSGINFTYHTPLKARIDFGVGGINSQIVVDAYPGAILEVPSDTVRVSFFWDIPLLPNNRPNPIVVNQYAFPDTCNAKASIRRTYTESTAHRTFDFVSISSQPGDIWGGLVPNFAKRFTLQSGGRTPALTPSSPLYDANTELTFFSGDAQIMEYGGNEIEAAIRSGNPYLDIPSNAERWEVRTINPPATNFVNVSISFQLSF